MTPPLPGLLGRRGRPGRPGRPESPGLFAGPHQYPKTGEIPEIFSASERSESNLLKNILFPGALGGGGGAARARAGKNKRILWRKSFFLEKNEKNAIFSEKKISAQKRRTELHMGTRPKIRSSLRSSVTRLSIRISDGNFAFVSPHI